ncbi:MAG TPA: ATP-binding protein [Anaerolineae bacterium]|nr:ATP-binding protein [Anaerolineae bacterium]
MTSAIQRGGRRLRRFMHSIRFRLTLWSVLILGLALIIFSAFVVIMQTRVLEIEAQNEAQLHSGQLLGYFDSETRQLRLPPLGGLREPLLTSGSFVLIVNADGTVVQQIGVLGNLDRQSLAARLLDRQGGINPKIGPTKLSSIFQLAGLFLKGRLFDLFAAALKRVTTLFSAGLHGLPFSETFIPVETAGAPRYFIHAAPLLLKDNTFFGTLIVGQPVDLGAQLQRLIGTLLLAVPATLLVALLGGYWLASRAMRPVHRITRTARTIGETDLSQRLNLNTSDEIGELALTFDEMLDRLQAAFTRQRQFTADASHELRTPLTIIDLEVNRALAQPRTPAEYEQALATIGAENDHMSRLVNNLLLLARADAGQAVLQRERLDLSDIALEVIERLAPLARQNQVELTAGDLPELTLCGDRIYLAQMITNLIENAIKYTTGTGRHVWIEVEGRSGWGTVRVSDDGPGINAEHLPYIFERFYRADPARSDAENTPDGSGLGLSIVQWVAGAHGGAVSVSSSIGHGATFEVRLPLTPTG